MRLEDWTERWRENRIGFHQRAVNPHLIRYAGRFPAGRVLVPLCGKSRDMTWLRDRGLEVTGVEFVETACRAFFEEQSMPYTQAGRRFTGEGVTLWADDFFRVSPAELGTFDWVFDRAALIAMPHADQKRYAEHVTSFLPANGSMLLVAACYDTSKTRGPPFAVTPADVERLFEGAELEKLEERDVIDENPHFRERGLDSLIEHVWIVTVR